MGLFEGIGGFSLAARWAGWNTPVMVEWNTYCQSVLKKNFPDATIFSDIRNFDGRPYAGQIDIVTGGFPCQPFSTAGKRAGTNDDRYLWPEMYRIIREVAPTWVVGENVAGLLSMDGGRVFAGILADLENAGYRTEVYLIPALAVGAPHRRDRLWIVAYSEGANDRRKSGVVRGKDGRQDEGLLSEPCGSDSRTSPHSDHIERDRSQGAWNGRAEPSNENSGHTANAQRWTWPQGRKPKHNEWGKQEQENRHEIRNGVKAGVEITADAYNHPRERQRRNGGEILRKQEPGGCCAGHWSEHWYEVATRICGVAHGLPAGLDGIGGVPKATTKGKAHRLEALGNAIVPHIAYQIFDAINQFECTTPST